jgi:exonuclease VII large subunit
MKSGSFFHFALLLLVCQRLSPAAAQAPAAPAVPALSPAQMILRVRLSGEERRVALLGDEIHNTDQRIEKRFDDLLAALRAVSDSKDSHTKVTRMKEETIKALQQSITYYQQKRAWLEEEMVRPTFNLTQVEKQSISNDFEERIEKRVQQILELYKTFPSHQDFARYMPLGNYGFGGVRYRDSEDYRQNLRLSSQTNTMRSQLLTDMQSNVERLEQENRTLGEMASNASNPEMREVYGDEQRKNEELRNVLKQDLDTAFSAPLTPGRPISGQEAQALDKVIKHSVDSLQSEFTLLFSRYAEWLTEASAVNTLRATVAKP